MTTRILFCSKQQNAFCRLSWQAFLDEAPFLPASTVKQRRFLLLSTEAYRVRVAKLSGGIGLVPTAADCRSAKILQFKNTTAQKYYSSKIQIKSKLTPQMALLLALLLAHFAEEN